MDSYMFITGLCVANDQIITTRLPWMLKLVLSENNSTLLMQHQHTVVTLTQCC